MPTVRFEDESYDCPKGRRLLDVVPIEATSLGQPSDRCGFAVCGKCVVRAEGALNDRTDRELSRLSPEQLEEDVRMACQARIQGEVEVERHNPRPEPEGTEGTPEPDSL